MIETALQPWQGAIKNSERKFGEIVSETNVQVAWKAESMFALQAISSSDFLTKIANENPSSLRDAIINVASTGLTLNPALAYAYIIPRDGKACLDISYKGLIKLATDTGSMMWVRADLVYSKDSFVYHGPAREPSHSANPFEKRGEFVGVYCMAKTTDGDILTEVMSVEEIDKVKATSMSYAKNKKGPWKDWPGEMARKTVIKRASKTWPRTERSLGLAKAVEILNEDHAQELIANRDVKQEFIDKIDGFLDGDGHFDELQEWFNDNERCPEFERLAADEQKEVLNYKKQVEDVMKEKSQPLPPKTFECSSGLEVVVTDCDQCCPKHENCEELKNFKEKK